MFYIEIDKDLKLKLLTENDSEDFFALINKNRDYLEKFMPRISENNSIKTTKDVIKNFLNQFIENNGFRTGIFYKEILIGITGLKYIDWINKKTEIMIWIDKDFAGKGIGTKCQKKVIEIVFKEYKLHKLYARLSVQNISSMKMMEKSGFVLESISKKDELLFSGYTDVYVYSILENDYEEK